MVHSKLSAYLDCVIVAASCYVIAIRRKVHCDDLLDVALQHKYATPCPAIPYPTCSQTQHGHTAELEVAVQG